MPVVLVTGANRGIGLALSREFLAQGWQVFACCRQPEQAAELQALKTEASATATLEIMQLDVGDPVSISALAEKLGSTPLDLLLNNAGISGDSKHNTFGDMNYESWQEVLHINTLAPMQMAEALISNLEASEDGHIASISSGLGSIAAQEGYMLPYSVSKSALNSVMKSLSAILSGRVRVNLFSPGWVQTDMGGDQAPLTPAQSAASLYRNITGLESGATGRYVGINGENVPW